MASRPNFASLANASTTEVDKTLQGMLLTTFQTLMTLKLLLKFKAKLIAINELSNLNTNEVSRFYYLDNITAILLNK